MQRKVRQSLYSRAHDLHDVGLDVLIWFDGIWLVPYQMSHNFSNLTFLLSKLATFVLKMVVGG